MYSTVSLEIYKKKKFAVHDAFKVQTLKIISYSTDFIIPEKVKQRV